LALPPDQLNPLPLITGDDLKRLGLTPGPAYRDILDAVRDAQLDERLATRDDALAFVQQRPR
jgi:poly(A) polymerase